jgi:hypothetical protein
MIKKTDDDGFESAFWHFAAALRKLASDPEEQCCGGDHFETPWEMRQDFFVGLEIMLKSPSISLNDEQMLMLRTLEDLLQGLPIEAISPPLLHQGREASCSVAVRHPSWNAIRSKASELISMLEPLISRNRFFFNSDR